MFLADHVCVLQQLFSKVMKPVVIDKKTIVRTNLVPFLAFTGTLGLCRFHTVFVVGLGYFFEHPQHLHTSLVWQYVSWAFFLSDYRAQLD